MAYLIISANPLDKFLKIFKTGRLGNTGETYAIRDDGLIASETSFLSELKKNDPFIKTSVLRKKVIDPETREMTLMAYSLSKRKSESNILGYKDYRGVNVIGTWSWNENFSIGVTTEQDYNEAFKGLQLSHELINKFSMTLVVAFLILSLVFMYNSKLSSENQDILLKFNENLEVKVKEGNQRSKKKQIRQKVNSSLKCLMK